MATWESPGLNTELDLDVFLYSTYLMHGGYFNKKNKKNKKKILYLPSAVFITQRLVGPSKQLKQIIQILT